MVGLLLNVIVIRSTICAADCYRRDHILALRVLYGFGNLRTTQEVTRGGSTSFSKGRCHERITSILRRRLNSDTWQLR